MIILLNFTEVSLAIWDYAVYCAGATVLKVANLPAGQIEPHQFNNSPLFGEYTDKVLDFIYNNRLL